ncbi:MAG: hypothetical protein GXP27_18000 [Planctomycetes bacterium]|nr:hypothetical protein [Planctomycetota bacterium]
MSSVRLRRLQADYEKLRDYVKRHPRLRLIQAEGDPPERYQVEYQVRSLRQVDDRLKIVKSHMVEIILPRHYPRTPPLCRMLTPVFHPNIAPHAVCVGDHWSAGEPLWSIVARIGEMLAYQSYNTKSPLNGEAARWVEDHQDQLPLDPVSMLVEESEEAPPAAHPSVPKTPSPKAAREPDEIPVVRCPSCAARLRLKRKEPGQRVRCPRCHKVMVLHAEPH